MRQLFSEIGQQAPVIRERRETDQMSQMVTQTLPRGSFSTTASMLKYEQKIVVLLS